MLEQTFRLEVFEGKGFGSEPQALLCSARFNNITKTTPYSISSDTHGWNSTLLWSLNPEELRKLQSSGVNSCKLSVMRKDGHQLGWAMIDLRSAKLKLQHKGESKGQWITLNASKQLDAPQLKISFSFGDPRSQMLSGSSLSGSRRNSTTAAGSGSNSNSASLRPSRAPSRHASATAAPLLKSNSPLEHETQGARLLPQHPDTSTSPADGAPAELHTNGEASDPRLGGADKEECVAMPSVGRETAPTAHQQIEAAETSASRRALQAPGVVGLEGLECPLAGDVTAAPSSSTAGQCDPEIHPILGIPPQGLEHLTSKQQQQQSTSGLECAHTHYDREQQQEEEQLQQSGHASGAPSAIDITIAGSGIRDAEQRQHTSTIGWPSAGAEATAAGTAESGGVAVGVFNGSAFEEGAAGASVAAPSSRLGAVATPERPQNEPLLEAATSPELTSMSALIEGGDVPMAATSSWNGADTMRSFSFTLDLRSFQAGRRLPLSLASAYVVAHLPKELIAFLSSSGCPLPPRATPLRTLPAVDIARGSEGALPSGLLTIDFAAGVMGLAGLLATEPRVVLEVWHKERLRSDLLLGVGSVPLSTLLQDCWVDGYAPVYALMTRATPSGFKSTSAAAAAAGDPGEEKVAVGKLRVVLSLEDKGPAKTVAAAATPETKGTGQGGPTARLTPSPHIRRSRGTSGISSSGVGPLTGQGLLQTTPEKGNGESGLTGGAGLRVSERQQQLRQALGGGPTAAAAGGRGGAGHTGMQDGGSGSTGQEASMQRAGTTSSQPVRGTAAAATGRVAGVTKVQGSTGGLPPLPAPSPGDGPEHQQPRSPLRAHPQQQLGLQPTAAAAGQFVGDFRQLPEYLVAWELEVWKKSEEAKFCSELRELEMQRCAMLEGEWRKREVAREAQHAAAVAATTQVQEKARQVLLSAEAREAKLVTAEEALLSRKQELERQAAARLAEAEAAVRRLQVECEHQLALERSHREELGRQKAAAEQRALTVEAAAAALEAQFAAYRSSQRSTPEGELAAQLAEVKQELASMKNRLGKVNHTKRKYKEQVLMLARELALLQKQQQAAAAAAAAAQASVPLLQQQQQQRAEASTSLQSASDVDILKKAAQEQLSVAAERQTELKQLQEELQALKAAAEADAPPRSSPQSKQQLGEQQQQQQQGHWKGRHRRRRHSQSQQQQQEQQLQGSHGEQDNSGSSDGSSSGAESGWDEDWRHGQGDWRPADGAGSEAEQQDPMDEEEALLMAVLSEGGLRSKLRRHGGNDKENHGKQQLHQDRSATSRQQQQQQGIGPKSPAIHAATSRQPLSPHQGQSGGALSAAAKADKAEAKGPGAGGAVAGKGAEQGAALEEDVLKEIRRLLGEKAELLASGLYSREDVVIQQLDRRVQQLAECT